MPSQVHVHGQTQEDQGRGDQVRPGEGVACEHEPEPEPEPPRKSRLLTPESCPCLALRSRHYLCQGRGLGLRVVRPQIKGNLGKREPRGAVLQSTHECARACAKAGIDVYAAQAACGAK